MAADAEHLFLIGHGIEGQAGQCASARRPDRIPRIGTQPFFAPRLGGGSLRAAIDRDPKLGPVLRSVEVPSAVGVVIVIRTNAAVRIW